MVPKVAARGRSFAGAIRYYNHDPEAQTRARVVFAETLNLRTDDPDRAAELMAWTAGHCAELKAQAGVKATGRKPEKPVYAFSLSWGREETPDPAHMRVQGRGALEALGLSGHEAVLIGHRDREHPHIHVIVNLVHPETGKTANVYRDRLTLSKWAEAYEREHQNILCPRRVENNAERARGSFVKQRDAVIQSAWEQSDNGRSFIRALAEQGYVLARGDRRDFVVIDPHGRTINPARQIAGVKVKDIRARLADLDAAALPGAQEARKRQEERLYFDREAWGRTQDEKNIEAAIAAERQGQDQTRRTEGRESGAQGSGRQAARTARQTQAQARPYRSYAQELDARRALEAEQQRRRDELKENLTRTYRRGELEKQLNAARAQAERSDSFWGRLTGRQQRAQEAAEALRLNLENIRQREAEQIQVLERRFQEERQAMESRRSEREPVPERQPAREPAQETRAAPDQALKHQGERTQQSEPPTNDNARQADHAPGQTRGRDGGGYER